MDRLSIRNTSRVWSRAIVDGLLPRHCVMCGHASGAENLCRPCLAELPRPGHCCHQCGLPLSHPEDLVCSHCLRHAPPWTSAIAPLLYCFPVDQLVCRFKFSRSLACGQVLAREIIREVNEKCEKMPGCIVPVPLHPLRHFTRAFNQADLLARQAGKALGIPVYGSVLKRIRRTRAHSGLDAAHRKSNIKGAFCCKIPARKQADFTHVALLDDVLTTGATLGECARIMKRAGAGRISVWVAARAPDP